MTSKDSARRRRYALLKQAPGEPVALLHHGPGCAGGARRVNRVLSAVGLIYAHHNNLTRTA